MTLFFFKQKTAYEMRISDWSSDVCSSDLLPPLEEVTVPQLPPATYDRNDYARIQLLLEEAGHSPGPVDGQWGPRTPRALAAFQNDKGLRPRGKPDAATQIGRAPGRERGCRDV